MLEIPRTEEDAPIEDQEINMGGELMECGVATSGMKEQAEKVNEGFFDQLKQKGLDFGEKMRPVAGVALNLATLASLGAIAGMIFAPDTTYSVIGEPVVAAISGLFDAVDEWAKNAPDWQLFIAAAALYALIPVGTKVAGGSNEGERSIEDVQKK